MTIHRRVRVKEAEEAIFHPNAEVQGDEPDRNYGHIPERDVIVYTLFGYHDYLDGDDYPRLGDKSTEVLAEDRKEAFAKMVSTDGRPPKFYVKAGMNGRFYNPIGTDEGRHTKYLRHAGRDEFVYHEVNKRVFTFYLNFLKTKNRAYFINAEREGF